MDYTFSYNSFRFHLLSFSTPKYTDNSHGIVTHFFGRLRKGSGTLRALSGETLCLKAGDLFYIPIGLRYYSDWRVDSDGRLEWESYSFPSFPSKSEKKYSLQSFSPSRVAEGWLDRIVSETASPTDAIGYFFLFMNEALSVMTESAPNPEDALFEQAKAYVTAHPDFKVADLARFCNVSESGLFSLFQRRGLTPIELKHRILIEKAVNLLTSTDESVEAISDRLGFCSTGYFRKVFRRVTGKTPMEIRRERASVIAM